MRILWTLFKVALGLVIAIPLLMVALVLTLGVLGGVFGLAVLALKLAFVAFIGYGLFRVVRHFFAPAPSVKSAQAPELPAPDRYYEAAMKELDAHMGRAPGR